MENHGGKADLRRKADLLRRALHAEHPEAGSAIALHFSKLALPERATIAGYLPTRTEADPTPLLEELRLRGWSVALPRVTGKDQALAFHLWQSRAVPVRGAFQLLEPAADWPLTIPEFVLVPLLAYDRDGYRLGYGGGFYDRTLRTLRAQGPVTAIGIGYSGQEMDLPHDPHDEPLDAIVTENGPRLFARVKAS
jgi:5-formyltetrahydrofolate cyclo-ligase